MTTSVFPALAGQGWSVHKRPTWSTLVAQHVSGREVRDQLWENPRWEFELVFNGLDGTPTGQFSGLGASSLQMLMGFFLSQGGMAQSFVFYDPTDYQVTAQAFGAGNGVATSFQLVRTLGTFAESIVAPVTNATTIYFPGQSVVAAAAASIYSNGVLVAPSAYSISNPGGVVSFTSPPVAGSPLTWSGYFGFLCRFDDDKIDFEQFMSNLWKADSVKFKTLRAL